MNFDKINLDELDEQAMQRLVFDSDEMSPILKGHIFIERILETLISRNLKKPQSLFKTRRAFELKLDLALAMGLVDQKHYSAFKALNKIRNNYAHVDGYEITIEALNSLKFDWEEIQNKAFKASTSKGAGEAARISIIFLSWKAIALL